MGRTPHVLVLGALLAVVCFLLSSSLSPLSQFDPVDDLPDWIDDVYLKFDTLRTDLADYRYPTDASRAMTSGFASFRTMHFHAGIDISTNGRTGYNVMASRSGYVSRVSVSPYGYGRMLHVRHPDGFTTVYAHLRNFDRRIENYVREVQYQNERYSIELQPGELQFPVQQGDTIAYSGDTGVGPAHFHFEIRDERMNPVNPLLCPDFSFAISDSRFPEFQQVSFAPFDFASRVDGTPSPVVQNALARGRHRYTLGRMVHMNGSIGVSIKGSDQADGTWARTNVYHYELLLDSTLLFTSTLDRFSAKMTEQIALHYDWSMLQSGEGRFQKLYLEPGNRLPLYSRSPERSGVLETFAFGTGEHSLRILARDIKGNTSELVVPVMFDDPPQIEVRKIETGYVLLTQSSSDLSSITIASRSGGAAGWTRRTYEPAKLASAEGYVLPIDLKDRRLVKVLARDENGSQSYPFFFTPSASPRSSNSSLSIKKEFLRDYIIVVLSSHLPITLRPSLWVSNGDRHSLVEIQARDERTYVGTIPLYSLTGGGVRLEASSGVNGTAVQAFDEFSVFPITPEDGGIVVAGDGEFMIDFPSHGVYQPLYCRIEKTDDGYAVFPKDILLNLGASVYYRVPETDHSERLGLYFSGEESFELLSQIPENGVLKGRVTSLLGNFAVRPDSLPPAISQVSIRRSKGNLRIGAHLRDNRSGVDANRIRVTVDGRLVIAAYDPYNHRILFDDTLELSPGGHSLNIEAGDKMGNTASVVRTFHTK